MIFKDVTPGSTSRLTTVDHTETYGRHILKSIVTRYDVSQCLDIGCGEGQDLAIVKQAHPNAKLFGIDVGLWHQDALKALGMTSISMNIEHETLPFENESFDFIIANQILEHTKEIFWINHEIFRCLKVNGVLYLGVPNVLSLHNRLLMLFGIHPTTHKLLSAHVRVFSKRDVYLFYRTIGNSFCRIEHFYGAQFYPFPKSIARVLATLFPSFALSSFYIIKKIGHYRDDFLDWPGRAQLETNFFTGSRD